MAIELITGVGETDHISSNDFRAFNRANFGQGRYILKDADDMAVNISAATGTISVSEGSCLWSGMHIRNASQERLTYVVPTTSQKVYVYLHYKKNAINSVETVEFVVSVGNTLSPIVNNLSDNTVEAYTLFCSFDATSSKYSNLTFEFHLIKTIEDLENDVKEAVDEDVVLFDGSVAPGTINLTESMDNFKYIIFEISGGDVPYHNMFCSNYIGDDFAVSVVGNDKWGNKASLFTSIYNLYGEKNSPTQLKILYTSRVIIDVSVTSLYGSDGMVVDMRIIGRERKSL